jgi:hypothetical protein
MLDRTGLAQAGVHFGRRQEAIENLNMRDAAVPGVGLSRKVANAIAVATPHAAVGAD